MSKINKLIPYYDRRKRRWRVEFTDRAPEEGDLLYVASEYARSGLYFPYNTSQTIGKEYNGHTHSFQGVLHALLNDPVGFTIAGFEESYSKQEQDFLSALRKKLIEDTYHGV